jgi:Ca2+-binding EF-hand superfamily protein
VSPYKEVDGSAESGAFAGFTVSGIVVLIAILYGLHIWRTNQQARRYKSKFAERNADTIDLRASMWQLPPEALASEFKRIDSETQDGSISKEALWNFMSTGQSGELSESDFHALFAAIDLSLTGTVDFLEFSLS